MRGLLAGYLGLVALSVLVQPAAAGRVGGLIGAVSASLQHLLDPSIPAIPDRAHPRAADSLPPSSRPRGPGRPISRPGHPAAE